MPISRCPGQDNRNWKSEDLTDAACPNCGRAMEFWKTEARRRCTGCGKNVLNPNLDIGCAKWCKQAADCLGLTPGGSRVDSLCDQLIGEMKRVFGDDQRRISHALTVLDFAERILPSEVVDPLVVKAAAVLHDIGIHPAPRGEQAEQKHGSGAGTFQEQEGPPIAAEILARLAVDGQRVEHILRIIASHHSARDIDTAEFRVCWDADRLANYDEECGQMDEAALRNFIDKVYRTPAGKALALATFLD